MSRKVDYWGLTGERSHSAIRAYQSKYSSWISQTKVEWIGPWERYFYDETAPSSYFFNYRQACFSDITSCTSLSCKYNGETKNSTVVSYQGGEILLPENKSSMTITGELTINYLFPEYVFDEKLEFPFFQAAQSMTIAGKCLKIEPLRYWLGVPSVGVGLGQTMSYQATFNYTRGGLFEVSHIPMFVVNKSQVHGDHWDNFQGTGQPHVTFTIGSFHHPFVYLYLDAPPCREEDKYIIGVNSDNDNQNTCEVFFNGKKVKEPVVDSEELSSVTDEGEITADDDLVPCHMNVSDAFEGGTFSLRKEGPVRVWLTPHKTKLLLDDNKPEITNLPLEGNGDFNVNDTLYIEGVETGEARLYLNVERNGKSESASIKMTLINVPLIPDYNHDRKVDKKDEEYASKLLTYCFWTNDDDDSGDTGGKDIPGEGFPDAESEFMSINSGVIDGTRDLVDWFPVFIDLKSTLTAIDASEYRFVLTSKSTNNFNMVFTDLKPGNAGDYLTVKKEADDLLKKYVTDFGELGVELPESFISAIKERGQGVILIEARKETDWPLQLKIFDEAGELIYVKELPIKISGVEKMFNRVDLISSLARGSLADEDIILAENTPHEYLQIDKDFVFIYGYSVNQQGGRGWLSENFKRMYWSGNLARYWGVTWLGYETKIGDLFTRNFHLNVLNALHTAPYLKELINRKINSRVILAAHSLGVMLSSKAVLDGANVEKYFMIDGAVAIEAFDGHAEYVIDMQHPDWEGYDDRLFSSEWHKLFTSQYNWEKKDARSSLTWRDFFSGVLEKTDVYNFYSSGEEVLAKHDYFRHPDMWDVSGIDKDDWWEVVLELLKGGNLYEGTWAWALQEKLKGRHKYDGWMGSPWGGWGLNLDDYSMISLDTDYLKSYLILYPDIDFEITPLPPEKADEEDEISNDELRKKPFFKKGGEKWDDLYVPESSKKPDKGSQSAKDNQFELLAEFFPARTLPVGANEVQKINQFYGKNKNFDMNEQMKNDNNDWPQERIISQWERDWRHNDIRVVSYLYVNKVFIEFVKIGVLNK
ncbi:hypothetical protein JXC34_04900 [Candidatus Woesearchaeota archaeon]|nr:hypothetical protein [Candidatus Woesearchaeota archaeon]